MRHDVPLRKACAVQVGGWVVVPDKGEGRISRLHSVPGCRMLQITLDNGWQFEVLMAQQVTFYTH
jgi:hypothetical protein